MSMRVGDNFTYQVYETQLSNLQAQMEQTSEEVASGKKVQVPSDNPSSYAQNLEVLAQQSQNTQYGKNLDSLQATGSYYETSVNSIGNILSSIQQLAVEQSSSTVDADSRTAAADEVNDLIQQLATVGNTKVGDTYIFGGTQSNNPPYTVDTSSGAPVVTFQGSAKVGQVAVNSSTTIDAGISGQSIFTGTVNGQSVDIFQTLQTFGADLANTANLSTTQQTAALETDLGNISSCVDLTANNLAYVGTYTKNINNLLTTNANANTTLAQDSSSLVDVDMAKAVSDYTTLSTAYQAALYTMSKVESMNILNYMPA
jgi:flagellar hook-associated protein 3 FlgL